MEKFSDKTEDLVSHITDEVRGIHRKILKIDFCGNFHRYNDSPTNKIRMQLKNEVETP